MGQKHVKTVRNGKRTLPWLFLVTGAVFSWLSFLLAEPAFNLKYLPSGFSMIALYSMLVTGVVIVFIVRRLGEIDPNAFADLPDELPVKSFYWISNKETVLYTILPGALVFGLHALNAGIQLHEPQVVTAEVTNRAWHKRNTDAPENASPVHMLDVSVAGIKLHGRTLTGTHRIQVDKDIWDEKREGDTIDLKLNTGALGWTYSINIDGQRNLMR